MYPLGSETHGGFSYAFGARSRLLAAAPLSFYQCVAMASSPTDTSAALHSIPEKRKCLRKAFGDLEEHRALIARCSQGWTELDAGLSAIYDALEKRYAEIVEKEMKFEQKMKEQTDALDKRESVIESREQASLARVQEQKDAAIAAIREQKRKWIEERQPLLSQSAAKMNPKSASSVPNLKDESGKASEGGADKENTGGKEIEGRLEQNNDTVAKKGSEEMSSGKINQKEDAHSELQKVKDNSTGTSQKNEESSKLDGSVGAGQASTFKHEEGMESEIATEETEEADGKTSSAEVNAEGLKDHPKAKEAGDGDVITAMDEDASDEDEKEESNKKVESSQSVLTARPELISFCEKMDARGLYAYLIAQKKVIKDIQKELPIAMKRASDPSELVLNAIKEYHPSDSGTEGGPVKKLASRRSCICLLESLAAIFNAEGRSGKGVSDDVKEKAKTIAKLWKSKLNLKENERAAQLDTQGFLQLVATFGLTPNFREEELCDIVIPICFRKQTLKLWRALGLAHKTSDLVDKLIKDVKHLDAIPFVQEYQLAEKFPPANLLKTYLKEMRIGNTSSTTAEAKDALHIKELNAARAVVKCVEKYKLQGDYAVEGLQRRILQLENLNSGDKKRVADTKVGGPKKAQAINGPGGPFRPSGRFGGRGNPDRAYGLTYARRGGYPHPARGRGFSSSFSHGNYHYGGGPPYRGPYLH